LFRFIPTTNERAHKGHLRKKFYRPQTNEETTAHTRVAIRVTPTIKPDSYHETSSGAARLFIHPGPFRGDQIDGLFNGKFSVGHRLFEWLLTKVPPIAPLCQAGSMFLPTN
jgi:hypothetical protein